MKKKKKKEKNIPFWNRLISSIFDSMSRREGEEIRVKRHWISRWIVRVGVRSCFSSRSRGWYLARERACCAQYSLFFSFSFLKLLVSTRREARREKGGEFIRGAACSSLCQQRQRELISFSLAEKAAQRRSKREPRGSNELREIHREIM